jgi:hypothetical protein
MNEKRGDITRTRGLIFTWYKLKLGLYRFPIKVRLAGARFDDFQVRDVLEQLLDFPKGLDVQDHGDRLAVLTEYNLFLYRHHGSPLSF